MEFVFGGSMKHETAETLKNVGDAVSVFTVVGALVEVLPSIAALFTIVWTGLRIYESETVQKLIKKRNGNAE
jgi:hypothetical protein